VRGCYSSVVAQWIVAAEIGEKYWFVFAELAGEGVVFAVVVVEERRKTEHHC